MHKQIIFSVILASFIATAIGDQDNLDTVIDSFTHSISIRYDAIYNDIAYSYHTEFRKDYIKKNNLTDESCFVLWPDHESSAQKADAAKLTKIGSTDLSFYLKFALNKYQDKKWFSYGLLPLAIGFGLGYTTLAFCPKTDASWHIVCSKEGVLSLVASALSGLLIGAGIRNSYETWQAKMIIDDLNAIQHNKQIVEKYS
ncbi:MAG: hypothetical protein AB7R69_03850 [Candidatus Babeliales bacterium]